MKNWVLVRGIVSEEYHWWKFLPMMKKRFRNHNIFTSDIVGNGVTRDFWTPLRVDANVQALRMQTPSKGKKILFGWSLGGMLATEWAFRYPEEVEALVLVNASFNSSAFYKRISPNALLNIVMMARVKDFRRREEMTLKLTTCLEEEKIKEIAPHWAKRGEVYPVNPVNFVRQLVVATQIRLRPTPPPVPTLLLCSGQDRVVHPDCSKHIADAWQVPLKIHPTAGHDLTLEEPAWVLDQVEQWLIRENLVKKSKTSKSRKPKIQSRSPSRDDLENP